MKIKFSVALLSLAAAYFLAAPSPATAQKLAGQTTEDALSSETLCGIARPRNCSIKVAIKLGMVATGLEPKFPENVNCRGIDDYWAMDYTFKRNREAYHGGIDLPAPFGTPMLAIADGTVIGKYDGEGSARGMEIILRHSPEDTGLPVWLYSAYGHLNEMPKKELGQRVRMGEVLGPTGNSGIQPKKGGGGNRPRRPAIHLAVTFSKSDKYVALPRIAVPVDGRWMDPNALYRKIPPFDSESLKALPDTEKKVLIPIMFEGGAFLPPDTKLIWPYACRKASAGPLTKAVTNQDRQQKRRGERRRRGRR
ncbi:MAG: M23 family metallopeptidase [Rhodospirillales bacterium]|nr:M23 family metallopeptidase [Rhodospirillales bacterium]